MLDVQRAEVGDDGVDRDTTDVAGAAEQRRPSVGGGVCLGDGAFWPDGTNSVAVACSVMPPLSNTDWIRPSMSSGERRSRVERVAADRGGARR